MSAVLDTTTADTYRTTIFPSTRTWDDFLPIQVPFVGLISREWVLVQPLTITIEFGDEGLIVSDDIFAMYGVGNTVSTALRDFIAVLTDYYELLASHADPASVQLFRYLQTYLQPTSFK